MTTIRSASARISSRSSLISSTPTPSSGRLAQVGVHGLDRADVEPARRRRRDQDLRLARELAAEHELLQVAAGEVARAAACGPGACTPVALDQLGARRRGSRARRSSGPRETPAAVRLEHRVLRDRQARRDAGAEAVLGDVRDPGRDRRRAGRPSAAAARRRARSRRSPGRIPVIASASSRWPLPATPATPTISPRADREATRRAPPPRRGRRAR